MTTVDTTTKAELSALNGTQVTGQIVERYNEPEWLAAARQVAWKQYAEAAFPSRVDHLWRYTDPGVFEPTTDTLFTASAGTVGEVDTPDPEIEHLSGFAVWSNGTVSKSHLDSQLQEAGVMLMDLHDAATQHQQLVKKYLGSAVSADFGKFEALNSAAWQAGLLVYIPRGVVVQKPLHVILAGNDVTPFFAPRILVVVEEGAQLTLVNEFTSPRQAKMSANAVIETVVEQAAHLRQVIVQRWGDQTISYITQRANIARDAQYLSVFAGLGAGVGKSIVVIAPSFGREVISPICWA
jgi:Fe-S cluster assembly protein SufD